MRSRVLERFHCLARPGFHNLSSERFFRQFSRQLPKGQSIDKACGGSTNLLCRVRVAEEIPERQERDTHHLRVFCNL